MVHSCLRYMSGWIPRVYGYSPGRPRRRSRSGGRSRSSYNGLTSIPESVNRRGSSGPTIGAIVRCSSAVAIRIQVTGDPDPRRRSLRAMNVTVRLFAGLRERAGADQVALELPDGARVVDALERMNALIAGVRVVMAVNQEYAEREQPLSAGDELALIPPVSGGSVGLAHVRVTTEPLSLDSLVARVSDPRAGAVVTFLGVTRQVAHLDYEAYVPMAEREMEAIVTLAMEEHGLCAAAAEHRVGTVELSEASVAIAASAPHRAEAFAGARQIIDEIKARAPIWKREEGEWVPGTPPPRVSPS